MCCNISRMIGSSEKVHLKILSSFETCLTTWPPCFVRRLLRTRTKSSWTSSWISKGGVFSFLCLSSNFFTCYKVNVVEGQLFFCFNNAFTFSLHSKMFPPFARYTPSTAFLNGGYNFNLKGFLAESPTCHTLVLINPHL